MLQMLLLFLGVIKKNLYDKTFLFFMLASTQFANTHAAKMSIRGRQNVTMQY